MPIAKITGQGLAAIGLSVALLWACLLKERTMWHTAVADRARVMQQVQRTHDRQMPLPVSSPFSPHRARVSTS